MNLNKGFNFSLNYSNTDIYGYELFFIDYLIELVTSHF